MQLSALLLATFLASGQNAPAATAEVPNCLVVLADEAQVAAQEAGVLVEVNAREGLAVDAGQLLARVDDAKSKMELRQTTAKLAVAREKASDDINVQYAIAAANVAKAEYQVNAEANRRVPGSVPQVEVSRLLLKVEETRLAIDKSKLDQRVAGHEANVAQADADAAQENIYRRQIKSPLDGVVVEQNRHPGEWVQPGDAVFHVVRMDRLWVEGFVSTTKFTRGELQDRPATIEITLARGQQVTYPGTVVFAKPTTEAGGTFLVRAEIRNQKEGGYWVLSPGLNAKMIIQVK